MQQIGHEPEKATCQTLLLCWRLSERCCSLLAAGCPLSRFTDLLSSRVPKSEVEWLSIHHHIRRVVVKNLQKTNKKKKKQTRKIQTEQKGKRGRGGMRLDWCCASNSALQLLPLPLLLPAPLPLSLLL